MGVGVCHGCPFVTESVHNSLDRISRRNQVVEGFTLGGLRISSLLFADYMVLLASSSGGVQLALEPLITSFG